MSETADLAYVVYIKTTSEQLWRALIEEDFTKQYWFGARIESTWEVGAPVFFWFPLGADEAEQRGMKRNEAGEALSDIGTVLAHQPFTLLSYTFQPQWDEEMRADQASRVTFSLAPGSNYVKLTVTHAQIPNRARLVDDLKQGWPAILSSLKSMLETGEALSIDFSATE